MLARRAGRIVNLSSGAGHVAMPDASAYASSKAALERLTDSVAAETAAAGVCLFALTPGNVPTAMHAYLARSEPWLNLATLRLKQGKSAEALPLFTKAIELGAEEPEIAYYGRGLAHEDLGDLKAAYADLTRAAELRPTWAEPAKELARYQVRRR
jgi:NAD(P)-dependent dehydrogenase (short-subunit alcohol dehydrogenase family)